MRHVWEYTGFGSLMFRGYTEDFLMPLQSSLWLLRRHCSATAAGPNFEIESWITQSMWWRSSISIKYPTPLSTPADDSRSIAPGDLKYNLTKLGIECANIEYPVLVFGIVNTPMPLIVSRSMARNSLIVCTCRYVASTWVWDIWVSDGSLLLWSRRVRGVCGLPWAGLRHGSCTYLRGPETEVTEVWCPDWWYNRAKMRKGKPVECISQKWTTNNRVLI